MLYTFVNFFAFISQTIRIGDAYKTILYTVLEHFKGIKKFSLSSMTQNWFHSQYFPLFLSFGRSFGVLTVSFHHLTVHCRDTNDKFFARRPRKSDVHTIHLPSFSYFDIFP